MENTLHPSLSNEKESGTLVMYVGQNCSDSGEYWSSVSLYAGADMPEGMSIRIIDSIADLMAMKDRWERLYAQSPEDTSLSFQGLLNFWNEVGRDNGYSLHILLVYYGGKVIGGIPMYAIDGNTVCLTNRKTLRLMKSDPNLSGHRVSSEINEPRNGLSVLAAAENGPAVVNALASYMRYSLDTCETVQLNNTTSVSTLPTESASMLISEEFGFQGGPAPYSMQGHFIHQIELVKERFVSLMDSAWRSMKRTRERTESHAITKRHMGVVSKGLELIKLASTAFAHTIKEFYRKPMADKIVGQTLRRLGSGMPITAQIAGAVPTQRRQLLRFGRGKQLVGHASSRNQLKEVEFP